MSVRRNSLYNRMPWTSWGGPIAFGAFGVGHRKGVAFGGLGQTQQCFRLRLGGVSFGRVLLLLWLFARFLCLAAFLLFVPNREF